MRQRAAPQERLDKSQRRQHVGSRGEPILASWEITTSEQAQQRIPEAPRSQGGGGAAAADVNQEASAASLQPYNNYPQQHHLQYQNGYPIESLGNRHIPRSKQLEQTPRLEDVHTVYRTPHHVADNKYQAYLLGQSARRRKGPLPIVTRECCAQTCIGFSAIAALFLFFIGFLLDTQPLFIKGALTPLVVQTDDGGRPVTMYIIPTTERLPAAAAAYQAGFMYLLMIGISFHTLYPSWFQSQVYRRQQRYQDIDDLSLADSTLPTFHTADDVDSSPMSSSSRAYHPNICCRSITSFKQWLAVRGWYKPRHYRKKHYQKTG